MSLDTVLQIGNVLRNSENNLKYFKYVEPCRKDKDGNWPICITIPVKEDFSYDWDSLEITPENQRKDLYYLKFKTSDSDGLVKYIFGDIYYEKRASVKRDGSIQSSEGGYYRLANPNHTNAAYRPSSFFRGMNDYNDLIKLHQEDYPSAILDFHEQLEKNIEYVERILRFTRAVLYFLEERKDLSIKYFLENEEELYLITIEHILKNTLPANLKRAGIPSVLSECNETQKRSIFNLDNISVFIHFEFSKIRHWYKFKTDMEILNSKILSEFVDSTPNGLVLRKTLYKTLCSGDKKNDIQFPLFSHNNRHKSMRFQNDNLQDLFYAIDYTNKGRQISGTDIKLIVLPRGNNLTVEDYEEFLEKRDENRIIDANDKDNHADFLFSFALNECKEITTFDLILCKKGKEASPDTDLIEISGIDKSKLRMIMERTREIAREIESERKDFFKTEKELSQLKIENSFRYILGNPQYDEKRRKVSFKSNPKYQSHLLSVLPLIYTESYHQDRILLLAFIQNAEYSIRAGDSKYNFLKYELKFLLKIQNTKNDKFMEITSSESYQIGFLLGGLAKNLKSKINSFEKNYVGNLTRRIGTLTDFIKLKNEIEQKLIMHDKAKFTFQTSYDLAQKVKEFKSRYDKEECAFGFMENYFKPLSEKEEGSTIDTDTMNNQ